MLAAATPHDGDGEDHVLTKLPTAAPIALALALVASTANVSLASDNRPRARFDPLLGSTPCIPGGNPIAPFVLPAGYTQRIIASEGSDFGDIPDMNTLNENGPQAGRFLYRTHEVSPNASVSVTDLRTGTTALLAQRDDWENFDGIAWTPWGTLIAAEEVVIAARRDREVPLATAGLVYEIDPRTGSATARPAIGSRSHEGLRFGPRGELYGISERDPGYIYRFQPDRRRDLSSGVLSALKVVSSAGDRTGQAVWIPLDRTSVQVDSDAAASAAGATGYARPEDVENGTSTGTGPDGDSVLYVAITGEHRVLAIESRGRDGAFVRDYVKAGVNAPADFEMPDNLALDGRGHLYIAEDPGGNFPTKMKGDDIWVALPGDDGIASDTVRFASLTDCDAEPTGIYFDLRSDRLFVNVQHRGGGDGRDLALVVQQLARNVNDRDD
jgi:uncharacterized protein